MRGTIYAVAFDDLEEGDEIELTATSMIDCQEGEVAQIAFTASKK